MKTISEVCKIVGITRKTLRGYDEIGLLSPTVKSEDGNHAWLYDDKAVETLRSIQIFIEAGYKRKDIKRILQDPNLDLAAEYDRIIDALEKKRDWITGWITTMKLMSAVIKTAPDIKRIMRKIDRRNKKLSDSKTDNISFMEALHKAIEFEAQLPEDAGDNAELVFPLFYRLIGIGLLQGKDISSKKVRDAVIAYIETVNHILLEDSPEDGSEHFSKAENAMLALTITEFYLSLDYIKMFIIDNAGQNAPSYILESLSTYAKSQYAPEEDFEQLKEEYRCLLKEGMYNEKISTDTWTRIWANWRGNEQGSGQERLPGR